MISKKDLLKEMNISYGQLYRWKREGLIPNDWFLKVSVSTGQETYFKRDLIIPRINKILELKDQYQLDELKEFLNPMSEARKYNIRELIVIDELDPFILKRFSKMKESFSIYDVIIIYIFSVNQDLLNFDNYNNLYINKEIHMNQLFVIFEFNNKNGFMIIEENLVLDPNMKIIKSIKLEDIATEIAKKL